MMTTRGRAAYVIGGTALIAWAFCVVCITTGCDILPRGFGDAARTAADAGASGRDKARAMLDSNASRVGWIGLALVLLSAASLIASFFTPIVTRREAFYGFVGALACFIFQYVLYVYGTVLAEATFWLGLVACVVGGVAFAYPYYRAWRRRVGADAVDQPSPTP